MNKYDDTDYQIEREESIEYKEGSDTNVGSIEKDIKRCEQLIKPEHANWIGISNQLAIAHVVDRVKELEIKQKEMCEEYCPKTERIKKLEEENQQKNMFVKMAKEVIENSILKQKVEGEIKSLRNMLKATTKGILQEYTVEEIIIKINTLEELLEEK